MHPEGRRKCLHCESFFVPDVRNRGHQRRCGKVECRRASKQASQRRWRARPENAGYFRGADAVARVQAWRRANPGYWKRSKRKGATALQDLLIVQVPGLSPDVKQDGRGALQDHWQMQAPVVIGLIAHLTGTALQEDIASMTGRLIAKGQALMGRKTSDADQTNLGFFRERCG
ncbi:MAG: hypothetical protein ACRD06_06040 [Terriglobia bacterium]